MYGRQRDPKFGVIGKNGRQKEVQASPPSSVCMETVAFSGGTSGVDGPAMLSILHFLRLGLFSAEDLFASSESHADGSMASPCMQ